MRCAWETCHFVAAGSTHPVVTASEQNASSVKVTSTGCSSRNNTHGEGSLDRQTKSAAGSRPYGDRGHLGTSGMFAKER